MTQLKAWNKLMSTTICEVLHLARYFIPPLIGAYLTLSFLQAWNIKTGGLDFRHSPFKDRIPERCKPYAWIGDIKGNTMVDALLLRGRFSRGSLETLTAENSDEAACLGYKIIAGLHSPSAAGVDFSKQWVDEKGEPIATVYVRYHKTVPSEFFNRINKSHGSNNK